jgi:tRNA/tmRNA/rRNA uracil-C5-methylase (TrmA/RlmC/RlmD family)
MSVVTTESALEKTSTPRKKHPKITMGTIAAILGVSKSMKRAAVLRQMARAYHGAESEYVPNIAAEYGDQYREAAEMRFTTKYKTEVIKVDPKKQHKIMNVHPWMIDSAKRPDRGLLYLRAPFGQRESADANDFKSLDDLPHHFAQMQIEMHLAGVAWGVFYQWSVVADKLEMIEADPAFVEGVLPQLDAFYAEYKEATKDKAHLEPLRKVIDNALAKKLIVEYDEMSIAEGNASTRKKEIMEKLKELAKDESVIICGRKLTKTPKAGSVGYAQIVKKLLPDLDLNEYRGASSTSWTLE